MESADIFLLAYGIYCQVTGRHPCQELIFIINNRLKFTDQLSELVRKYAKLILRMITDNNVQISLYHLNRHISNLLNRLSDTANNHE